VVVVGGSARRRFLAKGCQLRQGPRLAGGWECPLPRFRSRSRSGGCESRPSRRHQAHGRLRQQSRAKDGYGSEWTSPSAEGDSAFLFPILSDLFQFVVGAGSLRGKKLSLCGSDRQVVVQCKAAFPSRLVVQGKAGECRSGNCSGGESQRRRKIEDDVSGLSGSSRIVRGLREAPRLAKGSYFGRGGSRCVKGEAQLAVA
jgi:hypothetical protein